MTALEIFNCALIRVGCEPMADLTGTDKRQRMYDNIFSSTTRKLLYSHPWSFALKRVQLTENGNAPVFRFTSEFDTPADFIRLVSLYDADQCLDHSVEGKKVFANQTTIDMTYVKDVTDTSCFTDGFAELLELKLAEKMSFQFMQSTSFTASLKNDFKIMQEEVRSIDSQSSGSPQQFQDEVFLNSRL